MKTLRTDIRALVLAAAGVGAVLSGCSKPPPPPPPPPVRKAAPPPPEPVKTDALLQAMKADARVQFPQASAPTDETLARAVISLADALARGDSDKMKTMLDAPGKTVLDKLVAAGAWEESTGKSIEAVRVAKLTETGDTATILLAVQEPRGAYPMGWAASRAAGTVVFTGLPTPNVVKPRASEFDTAGIVPGVDAAGPEPADAATKDDKPGAESPKKDDKQPAKPDDGKTIRRTPNGPLEIPNPGGGGKPGSGG